MFSDLVRNDGGTATMSAWSATHRVDVEVGPSYRAAVVFAPKAAPAASSGASRGDFICLEPMAGITNAMNLAHRGAYDELQVHSCRRNVDGDVPGAAVRDSKEEGTRESACESEWEPSAVAERKARSDARGWGPGRNKRRSGAPRAVSKADKGTRVADKTVLDRFRLDGKVALVTGGARGLGLTMATALAEAGADIAISRPHAGSCEEAAPQIAKQTGRKAVAFEADVTKLADVEKLAADVEARSAGSTS